MKKLPEQLLDSLLCAEGFDRERFVQVHEQGQQVTSIRMNPAKTSIVNSESSPGKDFRLPPLDDQLLEKSPVHNLLPIAIGITIDESVPWSQYGFYLKERPSFTFDPLFHAGCYYVQEASSMFLEQAFKQLVDLSLPLKILDLCAAPGGKSTHIHSLISEDSLLVTNEIVKSRNNVLRDNIVKWGCGNAIVTNNDPSSFKRLEGYFDVMLVDAPCSGSGLFRKDEEAIEEWSVNNVQLCSQRQQRILADALPSLKEGGILIYSTCSYSIEEDENIADWLVEEFEMTNLRMKMEEDWNIVETESPKSKSRGYRFYPDKLKGEGFFLACFQKSVSAGEPGGRPSKPEKASAKDREIIQPWLKEGDRELIRHGHSFFAFPSALVREYLLLRSSLNIQYAGTGIGQIMKDRLVPDHSLALSTIISDRVAFTDVSPGEAIKYLQRQELNFNTSGKGWQLVRYAGHNLGWINVLPNRINNYYPKEMRILKQRNDSAFEK